MGASPRSMGISITGALPSSRVEKERSTLSRSTVTHAAPLKGALTSSRAVSPGAYSVGRVGVPCGLHRDNSKPGCRARWRRVEAWRRRIPGNWPPCAREGPWQKPVSSYCPASTAAKCCVAGPVDFNVAFEHVGINRLGAIADGPAGALHAHRLRLHALELEVRGHRLRPRFAVRPDGHDLQRRFLAGGPNRVRLAQAQVKIRTVPGELRAAGNGLLIQVGGFDQQRHQARPGARRYWTAFPA